jgi:uncharacterized membrane protein YphA (DoxX/SURF4 family)
MLTVVLLVALRLGLGFHFLYEGVWKIEHHNEFTAEPFLTQAKGPLAGVFYAMIPDIDGQQRLHAELLIEKDKDGKDVVKDEALTRRWDGIRQRFLDYYRPGRKADDAVKAAFERLEKSAKEIYEKNCDAARKYLTDAWPDIKAYFAALERFHQGDVGEAGKEKSQNSAFEKERRWKEMQKLRGEAKVWLDALEARESSYKQSLQDLIEKREQKDEFFSAGINPFRWSRVQQINFAVTYGLSAIGLCLILGLCTRLAALGGATFMLFVVCTQPAWPGIYPPDVPQIGHALLVNKDFIDAGAGWTGSSITCWSIRS